MKRMIAIGVALFVSAIFAGEAVAQGPPAADYQNRYGWNPKILKLAGSGGGCDACGRHQGLFSRFFSKTQPAYVPPPQMPVAQGGTLVFPNHTYARSPRDFFMMDQ